MLLELITQEIPRDSSAQRAQDAMARFVAHEVARRTAGQRRAEAALAFRRVRVVGRVGVGVGLGRRVGVVAGLAGAGLLLLWWIATGVRAYLLPLGVVAASFGAGLAAVGGVSGWEWEWELYRGVLGGG